MTEEKNDTPKKQEQRQKKLDTVSFILVLILVGEIIFISFYFYLARSAAPVFHCTYLRSDQYEWVTDSIRDIIAGKDVDTLKIEDSIYLYPYVKDQYDCSIHNDFHAPKCQSCLSSRNFCYHSLKKAYQFAVRNQNVTARFFLFLSEVHTRASPGCLEN